MECCFSVCFLTYSLYQHLISCTWFEITLLHPFLMKIISDFILSFYYHTNNFIFGYSLIYIVN